MYKHIKISIPCDYIRIIILDRPECRNAIDQNTLFELIDILKKFDIDDNVRVTIIKGNGICFSSGYDIKMDHLKPLPYHLGGGVGKFQRSVVATWFSFWDLAKPIIAQVHGACLAGGSELASACDLIYVSDDAEIGYPPVRNLGLPDTQIFPFLIGMRLSMEMMITGNSISGYDAAKYGWATRSFPSDKLELETLNIAKTIAQISPEMTQFSKRSVHRAMEVMGLRQHLRFGTEIQALSFLSDTSQNTMEEIKKLGPSLAWKKRDRIFSKL